MILSHLFSPIGGESGTFSYPSFPLSPTIFDDSILIFHIFIFSPFLVDFSEIGQVADYLEVLAQMHRLDAELRRAQLYVCTAPLMTLAGVQDGISDFRDFPWIYIYIWSPWDKNMDIFMEDVGTGYFMDISRKNLGFPRKFPWTGQRPKNEIFMEKVIGGDLSKHRYRMGKLWYTN